VLDDDALEEVRTIRPAPDSIDDAGAPLHFLGDEATLGMADIHVIQDEMPARLERRGDVAGNAQLFSDSFEVAKTREEVQDVIESLVAERPTHVLSYETEMWTLIPLRVAKTRG